MTFLTEKVAMATKGTLKELGEFSLSNADKAETTINLNL